MRSVLITGSNGFIGSHLVRHFSNLNYKVLGVDRPSSYPPFPVKKNYFYFPLDLPDPIFIEKISEWRPDILINAAGNSSVQNSIANALGDFSGSVIIYFNVLDAIRKVSPETRVINLSSAAVYGNPAILPISESHLVKPISPYGFHKFLCEEISKEFYTIYKLSVCSARIFSAYGPGLRRQVIWDIIKKTIDDPEVKLSGTGKETRDFIHCDDIAKAIAIISERASFSSEVYNLASGSETTIQDLAKLIIQNLDLSKNIVFSGRERIGDPLNWRAEICKLQSLGFFPGISIEKGVSEVVLWAMEDLKR